MFVEQLRAIQERVGYLDDQDVEALSKQLGVPLHRLHEVISFFPHFRRHAPPDVEIHVCRDMACDLRGSAGCLAELSAIAGELGGESRVQVESVSCLGRCDGAPAVLIELHRKGHPDQARVLQRPTVGDYAARLRALIGAFRDGRDVPADEVDRSPRPWRIDPYQVAPAQTSGAVVTDNLQAPCVPEPYAAVIGFARDLKAAVQPDAQGRGSRTP